MNNSIPVRVQALSLVLCALALSPPPCKCRATEPARHP